jgi:hypothetical protein
MPAGKSPRVTYHLLNFGVHDVIGHILKAVRRRSHLEAKIGQVTH